MRGIQQTKLDFIQKTRSSWDLYEKTRARKFNSWGGGGVILKKKIPASACRKKKIACSTKVIESLWEKKGKNILPAILLGKKILDDQKSPAPPPTPKTWMVGPLWAVEDG